MTRKGFCISMGIFARKQASGLEVFIGSKGIYKCMLEAGFVERTEYIFWVLNNYWCDQAWTGG